jgi:HD-GYP domain-containing protein (c-di-GMP phosphodiesterase class II)
MSTLKVLNTNSLSLQTIPISIREIFFFNEAPCDFYKYENGHMSVALPRYTIINKNIFVNLIKAQHTELYISETDKIKLIEYQQKLLTQVTRSLSMGDPLQNAIRQMALMNINLKNLYQNPNQDEYLNLQFQCAKNLAIFLISHAQLIPQLYRHFTEQKVEYIYIQPLITSLLLIGLLKTTHLFTDKDIEQLFITSYFKDVGMSTIPQEKLSTSHLQPSEKLLIDQHTMHSRQILSGRIPLTKSQLNIIEYHHLISGHPHRPSAKKIENDDLSIIMGPETLFISILDIIVAMTSKRPYRESVKIVDALAHIKDLMVDQYPIEFKHLVLYFKSLLKK